MTSKVSNESINLFIRLYKYRPHPHHTPKENFVTESLAMLLSSDEKLLSQFFLNCLNKVVPDDVMVNTQVRFNQSIFDVVFTNNRNFYYVVECKMDASFVEGKNTESRSQLEKYKRDLEGMEFEQKGIIVISLRNPPVKHYEGINYFPLRWIDIKNFLEFQHSNSIFAEALRKQFVELLDFLKVDRTSKDNRLLWKCEICGLETRGQGIYSHREKHCKQYSFLFENENLRRKQEFLRKLEPHQVSINDLITIVCGFTKIEMRNFSEHEKVIFILRNSSLPKEFWLYFASKLHFCFSNKAFCKFLDKLRELLKDIDSVVEPSYVMNTYENLLLYKDIISAENSSLDKQVS